MLRADGDPYYQPRVWDNVARVYLPPGLAYRMRPGPGHPYLYRFPPPHHPIECWAAVRGMGGLEDCEDGTRCLAAGIERCLKLFRTGSWWTYMERVAAQVFLRPEQVALLYHLLTPLHTNGGAPESWKSRVWLERARLYRAAGLSETDRPWYRVEQEALGTELDRPVFMDFWGRHVQGEIEL